MIVQFTPDRDHKTYPSAPLRLVNLISTGPFRFKHAFSGLLGNRLCLHKSKSPASLPVPLPAKRPAAASVQQNEPPSLSIHSLNEAINPARSMSHYAWSHVLEWVDSRHPSACPPAPSLLAHPSAISVPEKNGMPHVQYPIPLSTPTCRSFTLWMFIPTPHGHRMRDGPSSSCCSLSRRISFSCPNGSDSPGI